MQIWSLPGPLLSALCTQHSPCPGAAVGISGSWTVAPCTQSCRDAYGPAPLGFLVHLVSDCLKNVGL